VNYFHIPKADSVPATHASFPEQPDKKTIFLLHYSYTPNSVTLKLETLKPETLKSENLKTQPQTSPHTWRHTAHRTPQTLNLKLTSPTASVSKPELAFAKALVSKPET
jgi:hypothetical protein